MRKFSVQFGQRLKDKLIPLIAESLTGDVVVLRNSVADVALERR